MGANGLAANGLGANGLAANGFVVTGSAATLLADAVLRVDAHFWIKRTLLQEARLNYGDFYQIRVVLYDPEGSLVYDESEEVIIEPTASSPGGGGAPFRFSQSAGNRGQPPSSGSIS